tara:strand:+ start:1076 stop:1291 length:216 start_codon:yes stop_codon:yes gene_type:complete
MLIADTAARSRAERQLEADYHSDCDLADREEEATRTMKEHDLALMNLPLEKRKDYVPDWWLDESYLEQDEL